MFIDWDFYFNLPYWTVHQAACLIAGCDPDLLTDTDKWRRECEKNPAVLIPRINRLDESTPRKEELTRVIRPITVALRRNATRKLLSPDDTLQKTHGPKIAESQELQKIAPIKLMNWAIAKNIGLPKEFIDFAKDFELPVNPYLTPPP